MDRLEECVIVGAGPIGLAAAVHLIERGISPLVIEAGEDAGANIRSWGHVQLFTPWALNLDELSARRLAASGWGYPDLMEVPTGDEFCRDYLTPLSRLPELQRKIRYGNRVEQISQMQGIYQIQLSDGETLRARALLDCSGTFANKRSASLISPALSGDRRIFTAIPDFDDQSVIDILLDGPVAVVGGGHSALSSVYGLLLLRQSKPDLQIIWLLNSHTRETVVEKEKTYFKDVIDGFVVDAIHALDHAVQNDLVEVVSQFELAKIEAGPTGLELKSQSGAAVQCSSAIVNIGFCPDYSIYEDVMQPVNPLACIDGIYDLIKPTENTCLTVREQELSQLVQDHEGHFVLGQKSYGSASTFLLKTGYGQVAAVADHLAKGLVRGVVCR